MLVLIVLLGVLFGSIRIGIHIRISSIRTCIRICIRVGPCRVVRCDYNRRRLRICATLAIVATPTTSIRSAQRFRVSISSCDG